MIIVTSIVTSSIPTMAAITPAIISTLATADRALGVALGAACEGAVDAQTAVVHDTPIRETAIETVSAFACTFLTSTVPEADCDNTYVNVLSKNNEGEKPCGVSINLHKLELPRTSSAVIIHNCVSFAIFNFK